MKRDNCIFVPPNITPPSPYKKGEIERAPEVFPKNNFKSVDFGTYKFVPPSEKNSPYRTVSEYEKQMGGCLINLLPIAPTANIPKQNGEVEYVDDKFIQNSSGLWCDIQGKCRQICNFYIKIREIIVHKKYYGEDRKFISFDIITQSGDLEQFELPLYEYKKMLYKLTCDYPQLFINPRFGNAPNYFAEYSAMVYAEALKSLKKRIVYDYHGWDQIHGTPVYLSKSLSYCNSDIYIPQVTKEKAAPIYLNGQSFLNIAKHVFAESGTVNTVATLRKILPIFLYAHAGYTAKILKDSGNELQFVLAIIGQTGSYKTSISKVIFETFNTRPMLNFQSTPRAIELYRDSCRDMTMILDDIFSCKDLESMDKFEKILRCFGDGIAKAKSDQTSNKIEQFDVRGGCVITAENDLAKQQSSHLRFLTVHVDNQSFSGQELKRWQDDASISTRNGKFTALQMYFGLYIHYLEKNFENIVDMVMSFAPPELNLEFPRLQSNYKCMAVLARIVVDCGIYSTALSRGEAEEIYEIWISVIQELILENQRESKISAPYKLFAYAINQGLGTGTAILASSKEKYSSDTTNSYCGYIDAKDGYYVLNPDKAYEFAERFYQKKGGAFHTSETSVYRELYDNGISIGYQETFKKKTGEVCTRPRYLKKVQINGISTLMLVINIASFSDLVKEL